MYIVFCLHPTPQTSITTLQDSIAANTTCSNEHGASQGALLFERLAAIASQKRSSDETETISNGTEPQKHTPVKESPAKKGRK